MYLKQLVLKGFKSFADRSVLAMEPGITAVVGPNGSGKSNISDAVLWVLGERNAKNLRGQVMEDVIFAGSSARKSVNVAEVTLVLDNSDGSLPVDFDEVAITRRMYRNGESDYLINNTIARRMDVLDILHDSGLGTGTHSIISQGHLDSILASRPEDRRALIEEAAGVLKHKQRKAKSERKLEQMDNHLARVNDVVREVERQLGPLQRKARRALQYGEVSAELKQVQLQLAVDGLRTHQAQWDALLARMESENAQLEACQKRSAEAEASYDALQDKIRTESSDIALLVGKQTRAAAIVERLDSTSVLLAEKRRNAEARCIELQESLDNNTKKKARIQEQLAQASDRCEKAQQATKAAQEEAAKAQAAYDEAHAARVNAERELQASSTARNRIQRDIEDTRKKLASAQEKYAGALGRVQAAEGLSRDYDQRVQLAQQALDAAEELCQKNQAALDAAQERSEELEQAAKRTREQRNAAQAAHDQARQAMVGLESNIAALQDAQRIANATLSPARAHVLESTDAALGKLAALTDAISIEAGFEALVERLLGADALALLAEDAKRAQAVDSLVKASGQQGAVSLMMVNDAARQATARANATYPADALMAKVSCAAAHADAVMALIGDVVVCESLEQALDRHAQDKAGLRFATADGSFVCANGKVVIAQGAAGSNAAGKAGSGANNADAGEGQFARSKHIKQLKSQLEEARQALTQAAEQLEAQRTQSTQANDALLAHRELMASLKGAASASKNEMSTARQSLDAARKTQESSQRNASDAQAIVDSTKPLVESLQTQLDQMNAEFEEARTAVRAAQSTLDPARKKEQDASAALSEAKLQAATRKQQDVYESHVVDELRNDLRGVSDSDESALKALSAKQFARRNIDPLRDTLRVLSEGATRVLAQLNEQLARAQESTTGAHAQATAARDALRSAQDALRVREDAIARLREDKVRLEMQVQASVDGIVTDLETPLEQALEIEALEDRAAAEDKAASLQRRIKNMGVINPDAAQEYEDLKARYDYLTAQLDDLTSARKALRRIDRVIEERMKDDFAQTFACVNGHFKQIFADLFPGGSAELSLVDPDDLENTGVEVTAQPLGKRITKMSLMSGGEKSLVALALLFAVYKTRSTPFYILDEVEAALDDSNLQRLMGYLEDLRHSTQLIMITHQRRTMETADVLFGVSMQADGVTKVISQRLDKALQYAE